MMAVVPRSQKLVSCGCPWFRTIRFVWFPTLRRLPALSIVVEHRPITPQPRHSLPTHLITVDIALLCQIQPSKGPNRLRRPSTGRMWKLRHDLKWVSVTLMFCNIQQCIIGSIYIVHSHVIIWAILYRSIKYSNCWYDFELSYSFSVGHSGWRGMSKWVRYIILGLICNLILCQN